MPKGARSNRQLYQRQSVQKLKAKGMTQTNSDTQRYAEQQRVGIWLLMGFNAATSETDYVELEDGVKRELSMCIRKIIYLKPNDVIATKCRIQITRREIEQLNWLYPTELNDNIINGYMRTITNRSNKWPTLPRAYAFDRFQESFMEKIKRSQFDRLHVETTRVNIFHYDVLLFPIHQQNHWCLITVHLRRREIEHYDSLGRTDGVLKQRIKSFITGEQIKHFGGIPNADDWTFIDATRPRQQNGYDCGVFACMYASMKAADYPVSFNQSNMMELRQLMMAELYSQQPLLIEYQFGN